MVGEENDAGPAKGAPRVLPIVFTWAMTDETRLSLRGEPRGWARALAQAVRSNGSWRAYVKVRV
jgi:hypothetical protein